MLLISEIKGAGGLTITSEVNNNAIFLNNVILENFYAKSSVLDIEINAQYHRLTLQKVSIFNICGSYAMIYCSNSDNKIILTDINKMFIYGMEIHGLYITFNDEKRNAKNELILMNVSISWLVSDIPSAQKHYT